MIQAIRKKRGVSQRDLASKTQISRGRLKKLEGGNFEDVSIAELRRISQVLDEKLETFIEAVTTENLPPDEVVKSSDFPLIIQRRRHGFKIVSYTAPLKDFFIGKIFLAPGKILEGERLDPASWIFLQTLLGSLEVRLAGRMLEVKEGHHFLFRRELDLNLKNPAGRECVALLLSSPSFLVCHS